MAKSVFEEIKVTADDLVKQVKKLIREGNVRRLTIKNSKGEKLVSTSLTLGAGGIGALIFLAPFISAVTFVALMVTEATILVERDAHFDEKEVEAEDIEVVDETE
ncbi:MAG TPA: hypothetical protein DCE78_04010 [Bacteroidetes bacterium]|nr:hypothetical protein [Bacteroidota bacterium]